MATRRALRQRTTAGARVSCATLVPVILGNPIGGSVFVGLVHHLIYRRSPPGQTSAPA
ncbi:MAG: hypothetical protein IT496_05845 [Gammaproteobacteria bacterium]|nr:hypothetical protein [Gammaproteobacteria bacterium]